MVTAAHVHVIGAGLAGLSAAAALAETGGRVTLYEITSHAGGRCRSYSDPVLKQTIDNGNHLILSGNEAALGYLRRIGASDRVTGPADARFAFVDRASGERWELVLGNGRLPWWVFDPRRRVPGTRARDYLALARLLWCSGHGALGERLSASGALYRRLIEPVLLAGLNNDPSRASASLAARLLRETVAAGGAKCRPLVARDGLGAAFVDPALDFLAARGAHVRYGAGLRAVHFADDCVRTLDFGLERVAVGRDEAVILAVPPEAAARLVPGLATPDAFHSIANLHFLVEQSRLAPLTGVINGLTQWIFAFPGRVSVTISHADALMRVRREDLARAVWHEVAAIAALPAALPLWQVVRERRATYATTPEQERRRPPARTRWRNLFLAGDWIATGLPPTIEGAVRSGNEAARLARSGG